MTVRRQERLGRCLGAAVAAVFVALGAVYVWTLIFSRFSSYDDEGFLMISVRGWMEGHALYDSVYTPYGPVYFFCEWLLHGLGGLPITHDVTGILCGVHWVVAAGLLAVAAGRISRSALLGGFVFIRAVVHLWSMANEPGHPQELVVVMLALACMLAARGLEKTWTAGGLGVIGALLVFIKINVGAFYVLALALTLAARISSDKRGRIAVAVAVCLSGVLPFILMRDHLAEPWAVRYAAAMCAALLAAGIVIWSSGADSEVRAVHLYAAGLGFAVAFLLILGGVLVAGSSMAGVLEYLVIGPSRVLARCCLPLECRHGDWSALAAVFAAGLFARGSKSSMRIWGPIAALKGLYAIVGGFVLVGHTGAQLYLLTPWTWLVLVQTKADAPADSSSFLRTFLCLAAIWQGFQAYPVAGTQLAVGTFLLVFAYALCLGDALAYVTDQALRVRRRLALLPQGRLWESLAVGFGLYLFGIHWCPVFETYRTWAAQEPLGLPGARLVRLPAGQVDNYRTISRYLAENCDTFVTFPGFNSLYFWSGKPPLTYFNIAEVLLLDKRQQEEVLVRLRNTKRALIVINTVTAPYVLEAEVLGDGPLAAFIREQCSEIARLGTFRILAPRSGPRVLTPNRVVRN